MNTPKNLVRVIFIGVMILLVSACTMPTGGTSVPPTARVPNPTAVTPKLPSNTPHPSNTPLTGDNTGARATPTRTPGPTFTPTMPDFDSILNFGGGGGPGCEIDPALPPNNARIRPLRNSVEICFYLQGLDLARTFKISLQQVGGSGTIIYSPDLWVDQNKKIRWAGYSDFNGRARWTNNGTLLLEEIWIHWQPHFPAGKWRLGLIQSNSAFSGFSLDFQDEGRMEIGVNALDPFFASQIMPSTLSHPLRTNDNGSVSVVGMNYPASVPVFILLYRERPSDSGYEFELVHKQQVNSDSSGVVQTVLPGPFEADQSYLIYGLTDPHTSIGGGVHGDCGGDVPCDFFDVVSLRSEIEAKYLALGGETGFLGKPTSPEQTTPDGVGHYRHYQVGSIYWSPGTGAFEVQGLIREKWAALGWEQGFGYPLTDELPTPDGIGRFNHFQNGSIYWTPDTGAWEVHGSIRDKWAELGWETGCLGYPVSDEENSAGGWVRQSRFEHGIIKWSPDQGAMATCY